MFIASLAFFPALSQTELTGLGLMQRPVVLVMRHPTQFGLSVLPTRRACRMMALENRGWAGE
jgi:hypothetical protein